jgi:hypothetical protein
MMPLLGVLAVGTACQTSSTGAAPLKICGTTLYSGASGAVVTNATGSQPVVAALTGSGDVVVLRLASGCSRGATYTFRPAGAGRVEKVAYANDHQAVALVLHVGRTPYQVSVLHPDGSPGLVRVIPSS